MSREALVQVNRRLERELRSLGGANSPEMREAAKVLKRSIRRVLSTRGGGQPSAPGQPPHRQSGRLAGSVRDGAVGPGRRVAVTWYTAPILEAGIDSSLPLRSGKRRRRPGGLARRQLKIAARPFLQRSLDAVRDQMPGVIATHMRDRLTEAT